MRLPCCFTALGLVLAGCDPCASACAELEGTTASVELGTGDAEFTSVTEGGTVGYVQGPQGGYHVFGSLHAKGFLAGNLNDVGDPCNPTVDFDVEPTDAAFGDVWDPLPRPLRALPSGELELVGNTVVLDIAEPSQAEGVEVTFSVTMSDPCGHSATDRRTVTLTFLDSEG